MLGLRNCGAPDPNIEIVRLRKATCMSTAGVWRFCVDLRPIKCANNELILWLALIAVLVRSGDVT